MTIPTSHPLYTARLQCDWAKKRIGNLKSSVTRFKNNADVLELSTEKDAQGRTYEVGYWPRRAPEAWGQLAREATGPLRSALNYIAWELAKKKVGTQPSLRTQFPIWDTRDDYVSRGKGHVRDIWPNALPEIESLQPYNSPQWPETHLLAVLRELTDKTNHRFIIQPSRVGHATVPAFGSVRLRLNDATIVNFGKHVLPEHFAPHVSIGVSLEIPFATPTIYGIDILDAIHQFIRDEVIPRLIPS